MSRHTLVAAFLIACCCYGTTLLAEQHQDTGTDTEAAATAEASSDAHDATAIPSTEA